MTEHQTVEYKQIWKDEYLKWICGFANAQGGVLVIGRNDAGEAVGVSQANCWRIFPTRCGIFWASCG